MSLEDVKAELLKAEFPALRPDHDPDIERYFDLRATGRSSDALSFYHSRIKPRYPDDEVRTLALRAYRLKHPSFAGFVARAYATLGDQLLERTKRMIKYVAMYAAAYDRSDAYATIKAAESILSMLPREKFAAVAAVERLRRHAELLDYQAAHLAAAEELVRAYLNERLDVVQTVRERRKRDRERAESEQRSLLVERDREETRKALETRRARETAKPTQRRPSRSAPKAVPVLDLSRIRFSAADIARMQIPPTVVKIEDRTLAFCFKYWNLVEDRAFERVLFLFSRKYGVKNYEAYSAIRDGRRRGRKDDEILATVLGILTTGYYYSVRGDVYLQRAWKRLKAKLEPSAPAAKTPKAKRLKRQRRPEARPAPIVAPAAEPLPEPAAPPEALPPMSRQETEPSVERAERRRGRPRKNEAERTAVSDAAASEETPEPPKENRIPKGSVSDRLRKLSGKSYDVFRDRFFTKARQAIRAVLAEAKQARKSLFASVPQAAENLVFNFLKAHYADPYMDWASSAEMRELAELGYELPSLDPVIDDCYRRL